jgi:hypothetical protein
VYDSFFTDPARGMVEVGCWAHYLGSAVIRRESVERAVER